MRAICYLLTIQPGKVDIYSRTSPCGHPTYVSTPPLWTLFPGPIQCDVDTNCFTTVDTPLFWTLLSGPQVFTLARFCCVVACQGSGVSSKNYFDRHMGHMAKKLWSVSGLVFQLDPVWECGFIDFRHKLLPQHCIQYSTSKILCLKSTATYAWKVNCLRPDNNNILSLSPVF